jgi:hypothetical protein
MDGDDLKVEGSFVWANTGEEYVIHILKAYFNKKHF